METINLTSKYNLQTKIALKVNNRTVIERHWFIDNKPIIFGDEAKDGLAEAEKLFRFIGDPRDLLSDNTNFTFQEIYDLLYEIPFPAKDKFQLIYYTGEDYIFHTERIDTFGDILKLWGYETVDEHKVKYYKYFETDRIVCSKVTESKIIGMHEELGKEYFTWYRA